MSRPVGSKNIKKKIIISRPLPKPPKEEDQGHIYKTSIAKDQNGRPVRDKYGRNQVELEEYTDEGESKPIYVGEDIVEELHVEDLGKKRINSYEEFPSLNTGKRHYDISIKHGEMTINVPFIHDFLDAVEVAHSQKIFYRSVSLGYSASEQCLLFILKKDIKGRIRLSEISPNKPKIINLEAFLDQLEIPHDGIDGEYCAEEVLTANEDLISWGVFLN